MPVDTMQVDKILVKIARIKCWSVFGQHGQNIGLVKPLMILNASLIQSLKNRTQEQNFNSKTITLLLLEN